MKPADLEKLRSFADHTEYRGTGWRLLTLIKENEELKAEVIKALNHVGNLAVLYPALAELTDWRKQAEQPESDPYAGMCAPGTHRWKSREINTPDVHDWDTWCDVCGCQSDPREVD